MMKTNGVYEESSIEYNTVISFFQREESGVQGGQMETEAASMPDR